MTANASGARTRRADVTNPTSIQTVVLQKWERQRQAWSKMHSTLLARTGHGSLGEGSARNFDTAPSRTRERFEDFNMLSAAVPQSQLNSHYTWESQLRCKNDREAIRYVLIGKAYYPYALFGKVKDPTAMKLSHPVFTRIISEEYDDGDDGDVEGLHGGADHGKTGAKSRAAAHGVLRRIMEAKKSGSRAEEIDFDLADTLCHGDYYQKQLIQYAPYVYNRFAHFLVPRQFLKVQGSSAPVMSQEEAEFLAKREAEERAAAEARGERPASADPVQFFPPPQQVKLVAPAHSGGSSPSLVKDSLTPSAATVGATRASVSVSFPKHTYADPLLPRGAGDVSTMGIPEVSMGRGDEDVSPGENVNHEEDLATSAVHGPSLEISARRLVFRARPGELVHGRVSISNTGPVTVYYSWVQVDVLAEWISECEMPDTEGASEGVATPRGGGASKSPKKAAAAAAARDNTMRAAGEDVAAARRRVMSKIHSMATHSQRSRHFFKLSTPLNGVLLPEATELVPFSFRSPSAGRFAQAYELLTIPPSPERIVVHLSALVGANELSAHTLAHPIEVALNAKVAADASRHMIQRIVSDETPYDGADLQQAIDAVQSAKMAPEMDSAAARAAELQEWYKANAQTFDGIPYNAEVYAKLFGLHRNLANAMQALGTPLHHGKKWGGSLAFLLADLSSLRDAACRTTLYDAFTTLLRAARVSQSPDEPLSVLLARAAAELARHVGARVMVVAEKEAAFAQLPRESALPISVSAGGVGSKKRSGSSVSKRSMMSAGKNGLLAGMGGAGVPPVLGSLRSGLRVPPATQEERDGLSAELEVLRTQRVAALEVQREGHVARYLKEMQRTIDAGCDLPLLDVVMASRVADIHRIQFMTEMEVDINADVIASKPLKKR